MCQPTVKDLETVFDQSLLGPPDWTEIQTDRHK